MSCNVAKQPDFVPKHSSDFFILSDNYTKFSLISLSRKITTYFLTKKLPSVEERQPFALCVDSLLTEPLYLSVDYVDIACLWVFGQPRHTHYLACDSHHKFGSAIYDQIRYLKSEA